MGRDRGRSFTTTRPAGFADRLETNDVGDAGMGERDHRGFSGVFTASDYNPVPDLHAAPPGTVTGRAVYSTRRTSLALTA